ncbi:Clavaminate synthase-like protein [Cristinia sonorae]|uniref:Clavaminate synthase-like protein n=1 Tax=Cristinia sonorae TaxID=1940300 RepID=A0A8K0UEK2_9AGAR|nr:Clavaminate synthase-like protein [Cristinia sonorae]
MTVSVPPVPRYVPAPTATEQLDYADLPIVDLSKINTPEGKAELATTVRDAMKDKGFFYVINHGLTPEQNERIFNVANVPLDQVSDEEKMKFDGKLQQTGSYQGYKPRQYWHVDNGVRDQIEHYNMNKDLHRKGHPNALQPYLPELEEFIKYNHFNILHPLLRLLALGMNIDEETFIPLHNFDRVGETFLRFMKYHPRSEDDEAKTKNVWLKGHTDFGTVSILWSQPVVALQILCPDEKWRYVNYIPNALVINAGDALEFLTGGFYRATIHRVVQPPESQRGYPRLGVFYFGMPDDDVKLSPLPDAPEWVDRRFKNEEAPTMGDYRKGRIIAYGNSETKKVDGKETVEVQMIGNVLVKHYN